MIDLHPRYLEKDGKREFVILSVEEYESLTAYLEDLQDLTELRAAKEAEGDSPSISLTEVMQRFGLEE